MKATMENVVWKARAACFQNILDIKNSKELTKAEKEEKMKFLSGWRDCLAFIIGESR